MNKVIVLGDLNVDVILGGMTKHPSLGEEILAVDYSRGPGGSAANVAVMLALNGCPVKLFSQVGDDDDGRFLLAALETRGIKPDTVAVSGSAATGVTVSLTYSRDRMFVSYPGMVTAARLEDMRDGYLNSGGHLHLASYFLQRGLQPSVGRLLATAKHNGMTTSLDPGHDPAGDWDIDGLAPYLRFLDWFMPNAAELKAITGTESIEDGLRALPNEATGVVVKAGADGALTRCNGVIEQYRGVRVTVVDTTGAGDCFDAGFLHGRCLGESVSAAAHRGNRYGAHAASCLGMPQRTLAGRLK